MMHIVFHFIKSSATGLAFMFFKKINEIHIHCMNKHNKINFYSWRFTLADSITMITTMQLRYQIKKIIEPCAAKSKLLVILGC